MPHIFFFFLESCLKADIHSSLFSGWQPEIKIQGCPHQFSDLRPLSTIPKPLVRPQEAGADTDMEGCCGCLKDVPRPSSTQGGCPHQEVLHCELYCVHLVHCWLFCIWLCALQLQSTVRKAVCLTSWTERLICGPCELEVMQRSIKAWEVVALALSSPASGLLLIEHRHVHVVD